jgi:hypothetical protein
MKIKNWYLTLNQKSCVFVTKDTYETEEQFKTEEIFVLGEVIKEKSEMIIYFSGKLKDINSKEIITAKDQKIELGPKMRMYQKFEHFTKIKTPIVYNWTIGKVNEELYIVGKIFEDGTLFDLKDKIISQDMLEGTLVLEKNNLVFVVWGSYSKYQKYLLSKYHMLDEGLLKSEPINLNENIDNFEELLDINDSMIFNENYAKKLEKYSKHSISNMIN